ncbi:uncharacterized protein ARMOST_14677 [Armillaria ostoyae]|uniref:Uncharacterized protein n=1 Tax=Armillaria ostoyae TaxID=47428 RepID=A0A284RRA5_ARMOS|nr:uncharacterized protein ARMOST_14677 [Armillaria ostoyae]
MLLQEKQDLEHKVYELRSQNVNAAPGPRMRSREYNTDKAGRELPTEEERKQDRSDSPSSLEDINKNQKKTSGAIKEKQKVTIEDVADSEDDEPVVKNKQMQMDLAFKDNAKVAGEGGSEKKKFFKKGYTSYSSDLKEPTYKIRLPIQERGDRAEVMERVMNIEVLITVGKLLSLSKLRDDIKSKLTLKWITFGKKGRSGKQQFSYFIEENPDEDEEEKEEEETEQVFPFDEVEVEDIEGSPGGAIYILKLPFVGSFMVLTETKNGVPAGSLVWQDLFLQYVNEVAECGEESKAVYMTKDSQALHSVFPFINGVKKFESLYYTGSQIVSMSEHITDQLGLIYDPDIVINMQSANKQVEKSLRIAKNVPFLFSDIMVYLQVHII